MPFSKAGVKSKSQWVCCCRRRLNCRGKWTMKRTIRNLTTKCVLVNAFERWFEVTMFETISLKNTSKQKYPQKMPKLYYTTIQLHKLKKLPLNICSRSLCIPEVPFIFASVLVSLLAITHFALSQKCCVLSGNKNYCPIFSLHIIGFANIYLRVNICIKLSNDSESKAMPTISIRACTNAVFIILFSSIVINICFILS